MKKILCLIFGCFLINPVFSAVNSSSNSFEIELTQVPPGSSKSHKGLSDGATAAIALGSTFGGLGILSGIGYYFFKHSKELACGFACDENCPYQLVDINNQEIITKSSHRYLIKAYEYTKKDNTQKFLLVADTNIKPNTYNTIFFEIPKEFKISKFEIIQASESYAVSDKLPELDTDIFLTPKDRIPIKIATISKKIDAKKGILIKQGQIINNGNKVLALTTSYKSNNKFETHKTYAIIVSFTAISK